MFELAAFRKANPTRPIYLLPLFLPVSVALGYVFMWATAMGLLAVMGLTSGEFGTRHFVWIFGGWIIFPHALLLHVLRQNYQEKHQLLLDLESFHLDKLSCHSDFDRNFICSAMEEWYGSQEAFMDFVRGPLGKELLAVLPSPSLPAGYAALIVSSAAALLLEMTIALHKAGAHAHVMTVFLTSWSSYVFCCLPVSLNLAFYLGDRLSGSSHCILATGKTILGTGTVLLWNIFGAALATQASRSTTVWFSLATFAFYFLVLLWTFKLSPSSCRLLGATKLPL